MAPIVPWIGVPFELILTRNYTRENTKALFSQQPNVQNVELSDAIYS